MVTTFGGLYLGAAAAGYTGVAVKQYRGRRKPHLLAGMTDTGKTQWHKSAAMDFHPIFDMERNPTTLDDRWKYKKKMTLDNTGKIYLFGLDLPGGPDYIEDQNRDLRKPRWGVFMVDVMQWEDDENWRTLDEMVRVIKDSIKEPKYALLWSPWNGWHEKRVPFTGKGIKVLTVILNKIDLIEHFSDENRAHFCRTVADHFMGNHSGNPLNRIRHDIIIQFIATSLKHGTYYPYRDLKGSPMKIKEYVDEVMDYT